jgi:hypothetical protein
MFLEDERWPDLSQRASYHTQNPHARCHNTGRIIYPVICEKTVYTKVALCSCQRNYEDPPEKKPPIAFFDDLPFAHTTDTQDSLYDEIERLREKYARPTPPTPQPIKDLVEHLAGISKPGPHPTLKIVPDETYFNDTDSTFLGRPPVNVWGDLDTDPTDPPD